MPVTRTCSRHNAPRTCQEITSGNHQGSALPKSVLAMLLANSVVQPLRFTIQPHLTCLATYCFPGKFLERGRYQMTTENNKALECTMRNAGLRSHMSAKNTNALQCSIWRATLSHHLWAWPPHCGHGYTESIQAHHGIAKVNPRPSVGMSPTSRGQSANGNPLGSMGNSPAFHEANAMAEL